MKFDVARAWKDEEYRLRLSEEDRLGLPENPIGELELTDADLEAVCGGNHKHKGNSHNCHNSNNCNDSNKGICISFGCSSFFCGGPPPIYN